MPIFIPLLMVAAAAASAAQNISAAKGAASFNAKTVKMNNEAAMANYRRNLEKFAELRVEKRRSSLELQGSIGNQYRRARNEFAGAFTDNWGTSAALFSRQLATRAGSDIEAVEQNLGRQLASVDDAQEESRLNLITEFKAPPPDQTRQAILSGVLSVGTAIAKSAFQVSEDNANERIRLAAGKQQDNIESLLSAIVSAGDFGGLLKDKP